MVNIVHNCDNMEFMAKIPDKYYELAIVDPPYGIDINKMNMGPKKTRKPDNSKKWDNKIPDKKYFEELQRISKNQILWGGNYFIKHLENTRCFIVWDKGPTLKGRDFAEAELAWSSFDKVVRIYVGSPNEIHRIHQTQKPVALYKWLLQNYAKEGDKIFDSHVGSGSSRIACYELGYHFEGCELDVDYWNDQEKRFKLEKAKIDNEFFIPSHENNLFSKIFT